MSSSPTETRQTPSPPRIVAISGVIFSSLYITSLVLVRLAVPADPKDPGIWLADPVHRNWVSIALNLVPFAGIAFLWFMAVLRNRIGLLEDRFFATVFLGSGLLFVAMLFAAVAVVRGLLETFAVPGRASADSETYVVGRAMAYALVNTFGMKMAAIFMFVTSTIGLRTAVLALGIGGGLRTWFDTAAGYHQLCMDRAGLPVLGAAGEHVHPHCGLPTRRPQMTATDESSALDNRWGSRHTDIGSSD